MDWERQRGTGEITETMETRVYRWTTVRDWGDSEGLGRLQRSWSPGCIGNKDGQQRETRGDSEGLGRLQRLWRLGYIGNKGGRQRETARDYSDHGDQGSLHRERGIHNTGRLGEI